MRRDSNSRCTVTSYQLPVTTYLDQIPKIDEEISILSRIASFEKLFAINDAFDKGIQEGISVGERKSYHSFDQVTPKTMAMKYYQIKSIPEIAID